ERGGVARRTRRWVHAKPEVTHVLRLRDPASGDSGGTGDRLASAGVAALSGAAAGAVRALPDRPAAPGDSGRAGLRVADSRAAAVPRAPARSVSAVRVATLASAGARA